MTLLFLVAIEKKVVEAPHTHGFYGQFVYQRIKTKSILRLRASEREY